jgi:pimeloyl-ACP methyl ester carboxylesterase
MLGKTVLAFVLVVASAAAYNALEIFYYRSAYPAPGRLYTIDGYAMHLYCTGVGSPTVIMEGGIGADWLTWQRVQPELAKVTRVCSYDRAGMGWSDWRPGAHDALATATRLNQLLQAAGMTGPFVLMGQSAGGLYVREYQAKYPQTVIGLVFVDATPPESFARIPGNRISAADWRKLQRQLFWQKLEVVTGISRVLGNCRGKTPHGLEAYEGWVKAKACRPSLLGGVLLELGDFEKSGEEVGQTESFGTLPVLIISQDPERSKPGWSAQEIAANPIWNSLQENLKGLTTHSCRIIAKTSGHHIELDRPDVIVAAVKKMILELRGKSEVPVKCDATATL